MGLFKKAEAATSQVEGWDGPDSLRPLLLPLEELRHDDANVRRHPERNVEVIKASLARFGQRKPIVVQRDGMRVRAGNGTLLAARALGWRYLAAVITDDDDATGAQYAVADNRASDLAEWDTDALLEQLQGTDELEALGFSLDELQDLLDLRDNPFTTERVNVDDLKDHPRNYQTHPEDEIQQIRASIQLHGFYRNIVVARDNTILAGHGVVLAARRMGKRRVPVIRLDLDPSEPRALKVLTSDNEIGNLAMTDDRALTELLKEILSSDGLEGTGYNEAQLSALVMTTRPAHEIKDKDTAAEWVGMPEYEKTPHPLKTIMSFEDSAAREDFYAKIGARPVREADVSSMWWPPRESFDDVKAVEFKE